MAENRLPRLHVPVALAAGAVIELAGDQAHRLRNVLRLGPGASAALFNAATGEWFCRIAELGRDRVRLGVERRLRPPEPEDGPWLLFAPVKRARLDWLVEKATELGAGALVPVWTARTQVERINLDRLTAHAIAAAEQSERLSIPSIRGAEPLDRVLAAWPGERALIVCDESGAAPPAIIVLPELARGASAVLVGPEGGFTETELDALVKLSFVTPVGLGPRVLRTETAALAGLAVLQAIAGDWRRARVR
ncbi:MAG: 16S rRNA (uracil(1498)-N(3))-methyltransferase [Alphaproteobacteria bacterium]|nr:16S rRNA (uracil(1498)-N(3))-methyltransferase [Alphaproteobacteria bacterium]MBV9862771.1 16S rRNA (uracil(1498)-N(3))-methyltransferase [Alphaproteobacteria bacterium]